MADGIRTEQLRTEAYKSQLEQKAERDIRDLKSKHQTELQRLVDTHAHTKEDLEKAYDVALSVTKDEQEKRLSEVRQNNEKQIEDEKLKGEEEVDHVRARYHEQVARYKANAEKQLEDLRRQTENSADVIKRTHERGKA